ncbi:MAG: hypothetical protein QNJ54_03060 [Prochloraceae cyanobacterium]|nr:hypothetical protein [Prochloraceae cyanobacterium]
MLEMLGKKRNQEFLWIVNLSVGNVDKLLVIKGCLDRSNFPLGVG